MRIGTQLLICLLCCQVCAAEPSWRALTDGWEFYQGDLGGPWEAIRKNVKADALQWSQVSVPHCYNNFDSVSPAEPYYQGPAWYRRSIDCRHRNASDRVLVRFEAAGQRAQVYLGAKLVADHVGGYSTFVVDITDTLLEGAFELAAVPLIVRCDNSRSIEQPPSDLSDFMLFGGLHRPVSIAFVPRVSLRRVDVTPVIGDSSQGSVKIDCLLRNPTNTGGDATASLTVRAPDGSAVKSLSIKAADVADGAPISFAFTLEDIQRWSPETPQLYSYTVAIEHNDGRHEIGGRFGFRKFRFTEGGPFYLNGKRLLLRGTSRHEDHAGYGAAVPPDVVRQELQMIKQMGANFIRLGHYQQSDFVLDLCDELGLLVWEEVPWCRGGLGGSDYKDAVRRMLHALINQHRNHPSIILWGLGNENDWPGDFAEFDKAEIREFMTELHRLAKELDPSRLTAIRRCDFCKDIVDVYSPSIWAGWYRGRYTDYKEVSDRERQRVSHFFHAEWGASQHAGRHSEMPDRGIETVVSGDADERSGDFLRTGGKARVSRDGDWSETYACNLIDWHLREQETMPWLTGAAHWVFKDFATPLRPDNPVPYVNQKGVVERDLTPKESYYVFQSYWAKKPMLRLYGHTWPTRYGVTGEEKLVKAYSNCDVVELFLNGVSCGQRRRDSRDFPAAGLRWRVVLNPGENHLVAKAVSGEETLTDELNVEYQTKQWGQVRRLALRIVKETAHFAMLEARALDDSGTLCLDAKTRVRFEVAGDGVLIADLGTAGGSRVVEMANGVASAVVKTGPGGAVASVSAEGLPSSFVRCECNSDTELSRRQATPAIR